MRFILLVGLLLLASCAEPLCPGIEGQERALCVIEEAKLAEEASLCLELEPGGFQEWCVNDVALLTDDLSACDLLDDYRSADFCRRDLIVARGEFEECATLSHAEAHDACYDHFARNESDWQRCLPIRKSTPRDECIDREARRARDPYGCLDLSIEYKDFNGRDACLFALSIAANNTETCRAISEQEQSIFCIINIAAKLQDPTICDELRNGASTCRSILQST